MTTQLDDRTRGSGSPIKLPGLGAARAPESLNDLALSPEALERIQAVRAAGIALDRFGQVEARNDREVRLRIASDFQDVRHRILDAIGRGKHLLYVPGSYDLVHVGHVSYMLEGIDQYIAKKPGISRKDLFVVALCDDDELVRGVKPPHLLAAKGEHPRPIECGELFEHLTPLHPRLLDLATLPIDLVAFIPAPTRFGDMLNSGLFQNWIKACEPIDTATAPAEISSTVERYNRLVANIRENRFTDILASFQRAKFNLDYHPETAAWDVGSWQLLMHRFLGDIHHPIEQRNYVRLISEHDVKYKDIAAQLMNICGIHHHFINDQPVVSTTTLIEKFGWEALIRAKISVFEKLAGF